MPTLDRLGPTKAVEQIGAAIGQEFPHAPLASASRLPEPELTAALDRLLQSGPISRQGAPTPLLPESHESRGTAMAPAAESLGYVGIAAELVMAPFRPFGKNNPFVAFGAP